MAEEILDLDAEFAGNEQILDLDAEFSTSRNYSADQLAAEEERKRTGKRKQFDTEPEFEGDAVPDAISLPTKEIGEFIEPYYDVDARRQIKDMGTPGAVVAAAESIPVAVTGLGTTPVQGDPNASLTARLSEGIGGGLVRTGLTGPLGPLAIGAGEASAKASQIATNEQEPLYTPGNLARIGVAGAVPAAASKVAGAVVPAAANVAKSTAGKVALGTLAGTAAELAGTEAIKGTEYLGTTEDPTLEGLGQALVPTPMDIVTAIPGVAGSAIQAVKAARAIPQYPKVPDIVADKNKIDESEVIQPTNGLRTREGQGQEAPAEEIVIDTTQHRPTGLEGEAIHSVVPTSDPAASPIPVPQDAGSGDKYIGGFNKQIFGATDDKPELQSVYEKQSADAGLNQLKPTTRTRESVARASNDIPDFRPEDLEKLSTYDDVRDWTPEQRQKLSDQRRTLGQLELDKPDLSPEEARMIKAVIKATKLVRGVPGSDLALSNTRATENTISDSVDAGDFKIAAKLALEEASPDGVIPRSALDAIRNMGNTPLDMARTVYRQSRRYHSFFHNFQIGNLLSNVVGTQAVNSFSNLVNLMAETVASKPSYYGERAKGIAAGVLPGLKRGTFALKEGFSKEALKNPKLAAEAPGFAFGGAFNPINIGGRAGFASDEFFKSMAEKSDLNALVKAKALELAGGEKTKAPSMEAQVLGDADTMKVLTKEAKDFARKATFQKVEGEAHNNEATKLMAEMEGAASRLINAGVFKGTRAEFRPIKALGVPFWQTILNVAKANVKYSPLGAAGALVQGARGKITPGQTVAQLALGTMPTMIGLALAENDLITGPLPKDPGEREAFFKSGKQPWTVQMPWGPVKLMWFGPFALSIGIGAAIKDAQRQSKNGKIGKETSTITAQAASNMYKLFAEGSPVIALNSLVSLFSDPNENKLKKWMADFGSQMVPAVSAQGAINRTFVDQKLRDTEGEGFLDEVYNKIVSRTLASSTLPERVSSLGTPSVRKESDPAYSELYRLGISVPQGERSYKDSETGESMEFTPDEFRKIMREGGAESNAELQSLIKSPQYQSMTDQEKIEEIEREFKFLKKNRGYIREDIKEARSRTKYPAGVP